MERSLLKPLIIDNGLRLGWLINPPDQQVEIYRPQRSIEVVPLPALLSSDEVLPECSLSIDDYIMCGCTAVLETQPADAQNDCQ